jgi:hypothetical protein
MPAGLIHQYHGEPFTAERSEVLRWIAAQPTLLNYLLNKLRCTKAIVFDKETSTWRGADTPALLRSESLNVTQRVPTQH